MNKRIPLILVKIGSTGRDSGTRSVIAFSPSTCTSPPRGSSEMTGASGGGGGGCEYLDAAAAAMLA